MTLNDLMEFGHVIEVHSDGTVTDSDEYCPEVVYVNLDADGQMTEYYDLPPGWSLMRGYTAQGDGAIMHPSEYIGGRMERDILANPGLYVAVIVDGLEPSESDDDTDVGWAVAFKETGGSPA